MRKLVFFSLLLFSAFAFSGTFVKCESRFGDISYADSVCPSGTTQLSKTELKPYKASQSISHKDLKNFNTFPEHESSSQQKAVLTSRLSQVQVSLSAIKKKMETFYMQNQRWPVTFLKIDLDPNTLKSSLINKTTLNKNGRIKIDLNRSFGHNKQLWLQPEPVMGNTQIEWQCFTNFPQSMLLVDQHDICQSRDI